MKAAYIFSFLPQGIRSSLVNGLTDKEGNRLNSGLSLIDDLSLKEQINILKLFISRMKSFEQERYRIINRSLNASLLTLSILVLVCFAYGLASYGSVDGIINFMESVLNRGGIHIIILPFIAGYIRTKTGTGSFTLLTRSGNYPLDAGFSFAAALGITLLFLLTLEPADPVAGNPALPVFTLAASATAAPAVEELFFRYLLFLKAGEKYGCVPAALFSSVLFSLVHIPDSLPLFFMYAGSGSLLCGLAWFRKSLFPAFLAHGLANVLIQVV